MKLSRFCMGQLIVVLYIVSMLFFINNFLDTGLLLVGISSLLLLFWSKQVIGNYTNVTVLFIGFSILYGMSGPINAVWGEGLHRIFSYPYAVKPFLMGYCLANIGMILGISFYYLINKNSNIRIEKFDLTINYIFLNRDKIINLAILLACTAVFSELINIIRVGGFGMLFVGKAMFQSQTSNLTLTLPSTEIMVISFSLIGLCLGVVKVNKYKSRKILRKTMAFIILSIPFILMKMILGQRGILLSFLICIIIVCNIFYAY